MIRPMLYGLFVKALVINAMTATKFNLRRLPHLSDIRQ